jgi:hypothetical protein
MIVWTRPSLIATVLTARSGTGPNFATSVVIEPSLFIAAKGDDKCDLWQGSNYCNPKVAKLNGFRVVRRQHEDRSGKHGRPVVSRSSPAPKRLPCRAAALVLSALEGGAFGFFYFLTVIVAESTAFLPVIPSRPARMPRKRC